jgi:anthranilate/para-aminobenzoate synthase component II
MAIQHRILPLFGVQFHPESVGTEMGMNLIKNFYAISLTRFGKV